MKWFLQFAFSCFLLLVIGGCTKPTPAAPVSANWKKMDLLSDANIILNTVTDGEKLYCAGAYMNTILDTANRPSYVSALVASVNRMPRNPNYFISFSADQATMYINSYRQMKNNYGTQVHVSQVDTLLKTFNADNQSSVERVAINDLGQVLVSGMEKANKYKFYLISFNIHDGVFDNAPKSVVKLALPTFFNPPTEVHTFHNFFFIEDYLSSALYKIDTNGQVVAVISPCWGGEMFSYDNKLYLVHGSYILSSSDDGSSFSGNSYNVDFNGYYFRSFGDKIFAFVPYSGVGVFEFTSTGFTLKQIQNKGLENTHISAVTFFNNKVYVSTFTGLYYLDWKDVIL